MSRSGALLSSSARARPAAAGPSIRPTSPGERARRLALLAEPRLPQPWDGGGGGGGGGGDSGGDSGGGGGGGGDSGGGGGRGGIVNQTDDQEEWTGNETQPPPQPVGRWSAHHGRPSDTRGGSDGTSANRDNFWGERSSDGRKPSLNILERIREWSADRSVYLCYADGGCRPNPGYGGSACMLEHAASKLRLLSQLSFPRQKLTNNIAELHAIYLALDLLAFASPRGTRWVILTDSQYSINVLLGRTAVNKNQELVGRVRSHMELAKHRWNLRDLELVWTKGHTKGPSKIQGNVTVDALATEARDKSIRGATCVPHVPLGYAATLSLDEITQPPPRIVKRSAPVSAPAAAPAAARTAPTFHHGHSTAPAYSAASATAAAAASASAAASMVTTHALYPASAAMYASPSLSSHPSPIPRATATTATTPVVWASISNATLPLPLPLPVDPPPPSDRPTTARADAERWFSLLQDKWRGQIPKLSQTRAECASLVAHEHCRQWASSASTKAWLIPDRTQWLARVYAKGLFQFGADFRLLDTVPPVSSSFHAGVVGRSSSSSSSSSKDQELLIGGTLVPASLFLRFLFQHFVRQSYELAAAEDREIPD